MMKESKNKPLFHLKHHHEIVELWHCYEHIFYRPWHSASYPLHWCTYYTYSQCCTYCTCTCSTAGRRRLAPVGTDWQRRSAPTSTRYRRLAQNKNEVTPTGTQFKGQILNTAGFNWIIAKLFFIYLLFYRANALKHASYRSQSNQQMRTTHCTCVPVNAVYMCTYQQPINVCMWRALCTLRRKYKLCSRHSNVSSYNTAYRVPLFILYAIIMCQQCQQHLRVIRIFKFNNSNLIKIK